MTLATAPARISPYSKKRQPLPPPPPRSNTFSYSFCHCVKYQHRLLPLIVILLLVLVSVRSVSHLSNFLNKTALKDVALPNTVTNTDTHISSSSSSSPSTTQKKTMPSSSPYHNWDLFSADFNLMLNTLKIFIYPPPPAASPKDKEEVNVRNIFNPHPHPYDPKLGNYFSEHMFKISLLQSPLLTTNPQEANFFFMPFSINSLRNDPRVHSEESIADFVAEYTNRVSRDFNFWNASMGSDHFFVCCHSVGRDAVSKHWELHNNAIQVACSSSYFQRLYVTHKDVALPQVWPRLPEKPLNPPHNRTRLAFFAGRAQNARVRQELMKAWEKDSFLDIFPGNSPFSYEEGFRRSKYCLHVKGYEVNSARISDALHYGCIPVIISDYYDLPFSNILDWSKFSIIISHQDVASLKEILLSVPPERYLSMYRSLCQVKKHFKWHTTPRGYDSFYMTAYQLWIRRGMHSLP